MSRVQRRDDCRVAEQVARREETVAELDLHAKYIGTLREADKIKEDLRRMQEHNDRQMESLITTARVCHTLTLQMTAPQNKRQRRIGQSREEAVVLTATEQRDGSRARLDLKGDEMRKEINAAKREQGN